MVEVERHLSEEELEHHIRNHSDPRMKDRLFFIRNLYDGDPIRRAIKKVGYGTTTGYNWLHSWNDDGLDGLEPNFDGGPPPKLTLKDEAKFIRHLAEGQVWTIDEILELLQEEFGVAYTERHVKRKLETYGLQYRKSRPYDYLWTDVHVEKLDSYLRGELPGHSE